MHLALQELTGLGAMKLHAILADAVAQLATGPHRLKRWRHINQVEPLTILAYFLQDVDREVRLRQARLGGENGRL